MPDTVCGKLFCVIGPMFAGKSTELLEQRKRWPGPLYSPSADVRPRVTHDGVAIECRIVDDAVDILRGGAEAYAPRCRRHWRGGCF